MSTAGLEDVSAELAGQYHASAMSPGAETGLEHALVAASQARSVAGFERAVAFLRMARDLAAHSSMSTRADVVWRLALAEAEALLLVEASVTADEALRLSAGVVDGDALASFLARFGRLLKEAGVAESGWRPLVERGLGMVTDRHDLTWARLALLLVRVRDRGRTESRHLARPRS